MSGSTHARRVCLCDSIPWVIHPKPAPRAFQLHPRRAAPKRQLAARLIQIEISDEKTSLSVGLEGEQSPVWFCDRRCLRCSFACAIYRRNKTRVFRGTTQDRLFVKCVFGIGKHARPVAADLADMCERKENELCAPSGRPANCLRITPAFVTNCDAKGEIACPENVSVLSEGWVRGLFGWIELSFILPSRYRAVGVDDARRNLQTPVRHPLRAKNDGDI